MPSKASRVAFVALCIGTCPGASAFAAGQTLPAEFVDDRVTLVVPDAARPALRFYTDSGGGANMISSAAAQRLGLPEIGSVPPDREGGAPMQLVAFPPLLERGGVPRPHVEPFLKGGLLVVPDIQMGGDGFLGSRWFAGRVWEFDYVAKTLKVFAKAEVADRSHAAPLAFRAGADGQRDLDFPRITVTIDGEAIDMLLDTGATAIVTPASTARFDRPVGTFIGTGFITKSTFDGWVARHPDWPVLEAAAGPSMASMIEVPSVEIAGLKSGPVWFTQRPDTNLRDFMSSMMDKPVEGALGGSALRGFRMTIDYPAAVAYFERPVAAAR